MVSFLGEMALLAGIGVLVVLLLSRVRLPVVAGLILAGVLVGPHGLGLVSDPHRVEVFAEVGVVLLLFTVGLELSLRRLARIGRLVAFGGTLQVGLTLAAAGGVALAHGEPLAHAILLGFIAAMSSTAIVLRALGERDEVDSPHGSFILGALIFQDLCVVPMLLVLPVLAGRAGGSPVAGLLLAFVKATAVVAAVLFVSRRVLPRLLAPIDRARSSELFLLFVVATCSGIAFLTGLAGLSVALGAFLAGVMLADTEQSHRALTEVLPLRDLFTSLFFVSVGMLFDPLVVVRQPFAVLGLSLAALVGKALIATLACLAMRFPLSVAVVAGAGLSSLGEFGFVLAQQAGELGLLDGRERTLVFAVTVLTMFVAPLAVRFGPHLAAGASKLHALERLLGTRGVEELSGRSEPLEGHVVVVGYGVAGRVLSHALRESAIPYVVLELSADTVREARQRREPVYHADATSEESLRHARVAQARALVLLMNDPSAAERVVAACRRHAPSTPVFVRAHYMRTADALVALGAREVVVEEVEAAVEMLARVLREFGTPRNVVADRLRTAREQTQSSARQLTIPRRRLGAMAELDDLKVESFLVQEGMACVGESAASLHLRARTGASLVAGRRGGRLMSNPQPSDPFVAGDVVYLIGEGPQLAAAFELLSSGRLPS